MSLLRHVMAEWTERMTKLELAAASATIQLAPNVASTPRLTMDASGRFLLRHDSGMTILDAQSGATLWSNAEAGASQVVALETGFAFLDLKTRRLVLLCSSDGKR